MEKSPIETKRLVQAVKTNENEATQAAGGGGGGGLSSIGGMVSNWIREDLSSLLSSHNTAQPITVNNDNDNNEKNDNDSQADDSNNNSEADDVGGDSEAAAAASSSSMTSSSSSTLLPAPCKRCSGWRVTHANDGGALCGSYPRRLVVPAAVPDVDLLRACAFRAARRGPVLAYRHTASGGSLLRSAQPHIGLAGNRDLADEVLLAAARRASASASAAASSSSSRSLYILDLRPLANAIANMAMGGGYEAPLYYERARVEFLGIANIHATRANLARLAAPLRAKTPDAAAMMEVR
jgi:hypothetical protein